MPITEPIAIVSTVAASPTISDDPRSPHELGGDRRPR